MQQLSIARLTQVYVNAHRGENDQPLTDLAPFLPHPVVWKQLSSNRQLNVSRQSAIAVIQSLDWLDSQVLAAIDSWLDELSLIAQGG